MKQISLFSWEQVHKDLPIIIMSIMSSRQNARQGKSVLIFNFGTLHTDPLTLLIFPDL